VSPRRRLKKTLEKGEDAKDAKLGTYGKVLIFLYNDYWEGKFYEQKEITVYYKLVGEKTMILTVKARYDERFEEVSK